MSTRKTSVTLRIYDKMSFITPTKRGLPFLLTVRGPPESPLHVLLPPAPLVQMLESWMVRGKEDLHTAFVITGRVTWLRPWLVVMAPDAPVKLTGLVTHFTELTKTVGPFGF